MSVFDLNGILLKKIRLNHLILKPVSICTTKTVDENMRILISDQGLRRILVFDKGVIIEDGSHKELLEKNGLYSKLYKHNN